MASVLKAGLQQTTSRPTAPTLGYAAIAAGAVTHQGGSTALTSVQTPVSTVTPYPIPPSITTQLATVSQHSSQEQQSAITTSPSLTQLSVTSPMLSSAASGSQQQDGSFYSGQDSPAVSEARAVPQSPSVLKGPSFRFYLIQKLILFCRFYFISYCWGFSANSYGLYPIQSFYCLVT